ncbi:uncharacterized protein LOC132888901 [Neoarius graeffei]|uniref:uncharacterized protein LOC132888901 n=1 Tax=Neoarius graeffei TaxID=443677 RepID=UPI00298D2513|nr:uncharacterized protein LOC132888901 [Neoarius graeffei]
MAGKRKGLQALIKRATPDTQWMHCILHREALASRHLSPELNEVLTAVVDVVSFIKTRPLKARLFSAICEEMGADHTTVLFHSEARWLPRGKVLSRGFELRTEIRVFLEEERMYEAVAKFGDELFLMKLAYLSDVFAKLNELNFQLQGKDKYLPHLADKITAFIRKLELHSIEDLQTVQIIKVLRYEKKLTTMFLLMGFCYLLCWTPYAVVSMLAAFGKQNAISPTVAIIPSFFAKSSTAYNSIIYGFMSRKFRHCMLQLLCSRLAHLHHDDSLAHQQCSIKDHPLTFSSQPVHPTMMSQSCDNRPKKRVTFNSSSIVFIIASNDTDPLDINDKCRESSEISVIQVQPL